MQSLGVQAQDRVLISFVRLQLPTKVVLQPLNKTWDTIFVNNTKRTGGEGGARLEKDVTRVLERQLNKFSALTARSVISLDIEGTEYSFLVKETKGETGVSVYGVRVQDADVTVEIDRSHLDLHTKTSFV